MRGRSAANALLVTSFPSEEQNTPFSLPFPLTASSISKSSTRRSTAMTSEGSFKVCSLVGLPRFGSEPRSEPEPTRTGPSVQSKVQEISGPDRFSRSGFKEFRFSLNRVQLGPDRSEPRTEYSERPPRHEVSYHHHVYCARSMILFLSLRFPLTVPFFFVRLAPHALRHPHHSSI
jgi:hypothetical protein